ncbi:rhamnogalacturonan acetylesterase [Lacrimispora sp.]|uniref:rhamnogalacturonan acetylesterase n=1 Tax=Lacrimispora sp. TaxID=2719234 RepID=UPI0028AB7C6E|nr:rhamnogalacturonan acetylesterase [Lacrimispora sp.]
MAAIFYAGDSTVKFNKISTYPQTGISQAMLWYLKDSVEMKSFAQNGRSTKSFIDEGRLALIEKEMKKGDFLFIQFGHNDEKDDPKRHTDPDTTFSENLLRFIKAARAKGAYPVLITPIARRLFNAHETFLPGSHGDYPEAMKRTAKKAGVPVIDLTSVTENYLSAVGDLASKAYFMWPKDDTHLKPEGAVLMAGFLCQGLKILGTPYSNLLEDGILIKENEGLDVS